jgi:hypothetical protein
MATTNTHEFTVGIARFAEEAEERHRKRTRAASLYGLRNLVLGTRQDTGRARGNWQVGEADPPEGFDPDVGQVGGRDAGRDVPSQRRDAVSEGAAVIDAASGEDVIWLHNGVPYITILEEKDKMLAGTVEALRTWIRSM